MANQTNKFIIKADIEDFDKKIKTLQRNYTSAMDSIAEASEQLVQSERKYNLSIKRTEEALRRKTIALQQSGGAITQSVKDEITRLRLATAQEAVDRKSVALLKNTVSARTKNSNTIKDEITSILAQKSALEQQSTSIDASTRATKNLTKANEKQAIGFDANRNSVIRHIRQLESLAVAFYSIKSTYDNTLGVGQEFNKLIESETIGLKLLISQNLSLTDARGNALTSLERYTLSQAEANKAIEIARKINVETPQSFGETLQIFKLLTPQVLQLGGSLEDVGEITKKMSIIAATAGVEYDQFLKTVDSSLSGEAKESGLRRALELFGITNEGIKEIKARNGDVVSYVINSLQQAGEAGKEINRSWAGILGQFRNEWDDLFGKIQKPIFDEFKVQISGATDFIKRNKDELVALAGSVGTLIQQSLLLATAYAGVKVALFGYNKVTELAGFFQTRLADATTLASRASERLGTKVSTTSVLVRGLGKSLLSFGAASLPFVALTLAFEAWNYATNRQVEAQAKLNDALSITRDKVSKLDDKAFIEQFNKVAEEYDKAYRKLEKLKDFKPYFARGASPKQNEDINTKRTLENQKQVEQQQKITDTLRTSLDALNSITDKERNLNIELEKQSSNRESINTDISNIKARLLEIRNLDGASYDEQRVKLKEALVEKNKELEANYLVSESIRDQLSKLGVIPLQYRLAAQEADKTAQSVQALAVATKSLETAYINADLAAGKINKRQAVTKKFELDSKSVEDEIKKLNESYEKGTISDEDKLTSLKAFTAQKLELETQYLNETNSIDEAKTTSINGLKIRLLEQRGQKEEALALKIDDINKSVSGNKISQEEASLKIQILRVEAEKEAESAAKRNIKSTASAQARNYKADIKAKKDLTASYRDFLETTGRTDELFNLDIQDKLKDLTLLFDEHKIKAEDIGEYYTKSWDNRIKDRVDKEKDANKEIALDFSQQFEGLFEGLIEGDLSSAIKGLFSGVSQELSKNVIGGLSNSVGGLFGGDTTGKTTLSSLTSGDFLSAGIGILTGVLPSLFGGENETPPILDDLARTSESTAKSLDFIKNAPNPLLDLTRQMTGYLSNISNAFGGIQNTLFNSNIDLSGASVQSTSKSSLFGGRSTELFGTSIRTDDATIQSFIDAQAQVTLDTIIKRTNEGLFSSSTSYTTQNTDLSSQVNRYLSNATQSAFDNLSLAGVAFNIDTSGLLGESINLGTFDTTGLSEGEIASQFEGRFNAQLDTITQEYFGVLSNYQLAGEGFNETINRAVVTSEQGAFSLGLIGKNFTNGITQYTNTIGELVDTTYTSQLQILDIVEGAGGLDGFNTAINAFTSNFYTAKEQYEQQIQSLDASFASLGVAVPKTNDEFRTLIENFDTSTVEGANLYGQLLTLSGAFADATQAGQSLAEEAKKIADEQAEEAKKAVEEAKKIADEQAEEAKKAVEEAKKIADEQIENQKRLADAQLKISKEQLEAFKKTAEDSRNAISNTLGLLSETYQNEYSLSTARDRANAASAFLAQARDTNTGQDVIKLSNDALKASFEASTTREEALRAINKNRNIIVEQAQDNTNADIIKAINQTNASIDKLQQTANKIEQTRRFIG